MDAALLTSVLLAPHDHPGWSRLRAELLAAYVGVPLPQPVHVPQTEWRAVYGGFERLREALRVGPVSRRDGYAITQNFDHYIRLLRKRGWPIVQSNGIYTLDSYRDMV